jgi:hypothetical protein
MTQGETGFLSEYKKAACGEVTPLNGLITPFLSTTDFRSGRFHRPMTDSPQWMNALLGVMQLPSLLLQ